MSPPGGADGSVTRAGAKFLMDQGRPVMRHGNWGMEYRLTHVPARSRGAGIVACLVIALLLALMSPVHVRADDNAAVVDRTMRAHLWVLEEGSTTISFDDEELSALELRASTDRAVPYQSKPGRDAGVITLKAVPGSTLNVEETPEGVVVTGASLFHKGGLSLSRDGSRAALAELTLADDGMAIGDLIARDRDGGAVGLLLRGVTIHVDNLSREVLLTTDVTMLSPTLAASLGVAGQSAYSVGTITFRGRFTRQPVDEHSEPVEGLLELDPWTRVTAGDSIGPDVTVLSLPNVNTYGSQIDPVSEERISAYAVATTSCNHGDEPAVWIAGINQHPVIAQNLYRLKDDTFQQIGMSWLKHGFFAVRGNQCGTCIDPGGVSGEHLGVDCSDPYSASLNGAQNNLGPRSPVNAYTGFFPYPFNRSHVPDKIDRRLQVKTADVDPDLNPGALYFVEGHYVTPDDAQAGNHFNNASYRRVLPARPSAGNNFCNTAGLDAAHDVCFFTSSLTHEGEPAIHGWKEFDASVHLSEALVPGEGMFELGVKVVDLQDGFWRYNYAVFNLNSHRSGGSFRVPIPEGAAVRNLEFSSPFYHSGEPYDNAPWSATIDTDAVIWSTTSFAENENANALRWGTLYNFSLEASAPPEPTSVSIGLFRPGSPSIVTANTVGPAGFADCNANGVADLCDVSCSFPGCEPPCGASDDCNANNLPDECEPDCNENGIADECDLTDETSTDCDGNNIPDECDPDCDGDGTPDACEEDLDADDDGVPDCDDLCPETTPPDMCLCPEFDLCCFSSGICIPGYPRSDCIAQGGLPECESSPCRDGCLVGDWDRDGDIDLFDMSMFLTCFTGFDATGQAQPSAECKLRFDFDNGQEIDGEDFRQFRSDFTGPH